MTTLKDIDDSEWIDIFDDEDDEVDPAIDMILEVLLSGVGLSED